MTPTFELQDIVHRASMELAASYRRTYGPGACYGQA